MLLSRFDYTMLVDDLKKGRHEPVLHWLKHRIGGAEALKKSHGKWKDSVEIETMGDCESKVAILRHMIKSKSEVKVWWDPEGECIGYWDGEKIMKIGVDKPT